MTNPIQQYTCTTVRDADGVKRMIDDLADAGQFAFDFETRSEDFDRYPDGALRKMTMEADLCSFAIPDKKAWVIPLGMVTIPNVRTDDFFPLVKPIMEDTGVLKLAWNFNYDAAVFANYDVWVACYEDVMVKAHTLDENKGAGLKERCADGGMELTPYDFKTYWKARHAFRKKECDRKGNMKVTESMLQQMETQYLGYSAEDSIATVVLNPIYDEELAKYPKLKELYHRLLNPAVRVVFNMERRGAPIDRTYFNVISRTCKEDMDHAEQQVYRAAQQHFNVGSTKDLGRVLYQDMGLPVFKTTEKGANSTDSSTLEKLAQAGYKIAEDILRFRHLSKLYGTYLDPDGGLQRAAYDWGSIHASFNMTGTATGRLSSSGPNMQHIPRSSAKTYYIRKGFIPHKGYRLVGGDQCLAQGTEIPTTRGVIPIEQVVKGDHVFNELYPTKVVGVKHTGSKECFRLECEDGSFILASALHRFRTLDKGEYVWKRLGDLREGDYLALNARPLVMDEVAPDYATSVFYGYMVANGSVGDYGVSVMIPEGDTEIQKRISAMWCKLFKHKGERTYKHCVEYRTKAKEAVQIMQSMGYSKSVVPSWILRSSSNIHGFIAGAFAADGSLAKNGVATFSTKVSSMASAMHALLNYAGVAASVTIDNKNGLAKNGDQLYISVVRVGTGEAHKLPSVLPRKTAHKKARNDSRYLPYQACTSMLDNESMRNVRNLKRDASQAVLSKISPLPEVANLVERGAIVFRKITSIKSVGATPTYDIEVADHRHTFIANGFVTHNSQVELRMMAHFSGDENMCAEYRKDEALWRALNNRASEEDVKILAKVKSDIHQRTADACKCKRNPTAKNINFGLLYGMMAKTLGMTLTSVNFQNCLEKGIPFDPLTDVVSTELAQEFYDFFFNQYPGVQQYQKFIGDKAARQGFIETRWGRRRRLPDLYSGDKYLVLGAKRQAVNCVDSETEALTKRGWVKGFDLTLADEILTKNATTGNLEWQRPTLIHLHKGYTGQLYEFKSKTFHAVTTPEHRWLIDGKRRHNECRLSKEISVHGDDSIHRTGAYSGGTDLSEDLCTLVGWFMSDGYIAAPCASSGNKSRRAGLCQSEKANPKYVWEIDRLIKRLKIRASRHKSKATQCVYWLFSVADSKWLLEQFPDREMTPAFALSLSAASASTVLEAWYKGDGCKSKGQRFSLVTRSEASAGALQYLYMLAGYATTSRYRKMRQATEQYDSMGNIPRCTGVWEVTVLRRTHTQLQKHQRTIYEGTADVWCPVVPNTYFVARRSGTVYVTGNTTIQGHVGEMMLLSMCKAENIIANPDGEALNKLGFRLFLQVHDEVIGECPDNPQTISDVQYHLTRIFQNPGPNSDAYPFASYRVPLIFEAKSGVTWDDVH